MDARTAVDPGEGRHLIVELEQKRIRQLAHLREPPLGDARLVKRDGDADRRAPTTTAAVAATPIRCRRTNFIAR